MILVESYRILFIQIECYKGEAGRRADNLDRAVEVGAGAVDATSSPLISLLVNAARVGIGATRNFASDLVASTTEQFKEEDIGEIAKKAAQMVAERYQNQIVQLHLTDPSGVLGFVQYCHNNAKNKLHSLVKEPIKNLWANFFGLRDDRTLSPEDLLFFALISPSGEKPFLRKKEETKLGEHWNADELMNCCGREHNGKKYMLKEGSQHDKYGFCQKNVDAKEIERLGLVPVPNA